MGKALGHTGEASGHKPLAETVSVLGIFQIQAWDTASSGGGIRSAQGAKAESALPSVGRRRNGLVDEKAESERAQRGGTAVKPPRWQNGTFWRGTYGKTDKPKVLGVFGIARPMGCGDGSWT